jgi:hypothetical protein
MWSRNHCFLTAKLTKKKKKTKKVKTGITSIRKTYEYDSYIIYNGLINSEVSASKMNLNQITFNFAKLATIQEQRKTMLPALLHIRPEFMKGPNMQVSLAGLSSLR